MIPSNEKIDGFLTQFYKNSEGKINFADFSKQCDYFYNSENRIISFAKTEKKDFDEFKNVLKKMKFAEKDSFCVPYSHFSALLKDNIAVFLSYFENVNEIRFVIEENSTYFDYSDEFDSEFCLPTLIYSQNLKEYGTSHAMRISDGRFIIFDGGVGYDEDIEGLLSYLKKQSKFEKPEIAAWVISHPHGDHYRALLNILDNRIDEICIERIFINFPEHDDVEQFEELLKVYKGETCSEALKRLSDLIKEHNIPTIRTHTGQRFRIGNTYSEVIASQDDHVGIEPAKKKNSLSSVFRMEVEGQVILWTADTQFNEVKLHNRYKDYLKCDILQIPHHGFIGGTPAGYEFMKPEVCLLPASHYEAYYSFDSYVPDTNFVFTKLGAKEIIDGTSDRTITLPYHAPDYAEAELRMNYLDGRDSNGAKSWFFGDLFSSNEEDCIFTFTNATYRKVVVNIDLFFEEKDDMIRFITVEVPRLSVKRINLKTCEGLGGDAGLFKNKALGELTLPEGKVFGARFVASQPVFVSQKGKTASYHSINR